MPTGESTAMLDTISGYLFCLIFGLLGVGAAVWLVATGEVINSIDDLFMVLASLLLGASCFGYLVWRVQAAWSAGAPDKK